MRIPDTILLIAVMVGCASPPAQLYPGPPLPPGEVVLLEQVWRAEVVAIDGEEVSGYAWTLLPGEHEIWVKGKIAGNTPGVIYKAWAYCRIVFEGVPGVAYRTGVGSRQKVTRRDTTQVMMTVYVAERDGDRQFESSGCR